MAGLVPHTYRSALLRKRLCLLSLRDLRIYSLPRRTQFSLFFDNFFCTSILTSGRVMPNPRMLRWRPSRCVQEESRVSVAEFQTRSYRCCNAASTSERCVSSAHLNRETFSPQMKGQYSYSYWSTVKVCSRTDAPPKMCLSTDNRAPFPMNLRFRLEPWIRNRSNAVRGSYDLGARVNACLDRNALSGVTIAARLGSSLDRRNFAHSR